MAKTTTAIIAAGIVAACTASAAHACKTTLEMTNYTQKTVNPLSCSTKKSGSNKWVTNFDCANLAVNNAQYQAPPSTRVKYKLRTSRKKKTSFQVRLTYKYVGESGIKYAYSNTTRCGTHAVDFK